MNFNRLSSLAHRHSEIYRHARIYRHAGLDPASIEPFSLWTPAQGRGDDVRGRHDGAFLHGGMP